MEDARTYVRNSTYLPTGNPDQSDSGTCLRQPRCRLVERDGRAESVRLRTLRWRCLCFSFRRFAGIIELASSIPEAACGKHGWSARKLGGKSSS